MIKIIFICALLLTSSHRDDNSKTVYVCDSKSAKKFHKNSKCRGLSTCQYKIVETNLGNATKKGMTLCRWEK
ncbi:5-bromo-4-chloroindolyl phosphate hydrolysis protein [Pedobacter sp. UYP24]